jgi:hypothetical protein
MKNYGEVLADALGGFLISYKEYGSYQGDYVAIIEKAQEWYIYKGHYGSCSGCDWFSGVGEYDDENYGRKNIAQKDIDEYLKENIPFLVIPKDQIPESISDLEALLPANSRTVQTESYDEVEFSPFLWKQMHNPEFDKLDYLEHKHEENSK